MTNREWVLNKLSKMTDEEFADKLYLNKMTDEEFTDKWYFAGDPWCVLTDCNDCDNDKTDCSTCCVNWLKAKHTEPMPELKPGMFVKVWNGFETNLGVIIENPYDSGLAVNYKDDAGWDRMDDLTVKAIYRAVMYSGCDEDNVIWMEE